MLTLGQSRRRLRFQEERGEDQYVLECRNHFASLVVIARVYLQGILGFFSGLPREAAEEVEQMAENITYTEEEERALCRKLDLRLLPLISFSYICSSPYYPFPDD